uniref:L-Fucosyltransferase n=1 Tax=Ditylenchus dipsaci TaxID=166011 RepID=A0A915CKV8_9BILA
MIGEDKNFINTINYSKEIKTVNTFSQMPRAEEMCLAAELCDSLVITAPISTFAFWIGYLMNPNSHVFYVANLNDGVPYNEDKFLPNWIAV